MLWLQARAVESLTVLMTQVFGSNVLGRFLARLESAGGIAELLFTSALTYDTPLYVAAAAALTSTSSSRHSQFCGVVLSKCQVLYAY
jgi:hypothetical protein